jgi:hypothetical protein
LVPDASSVSETTRSGQVPLRAQSTR